MTTDWVDAWDGLRGSRDWRAIIEAGTELRNVVAKARELWADRDRVDESARSITRTRNRSATPTSCSIGGAS